MIQDLGTRLAAVTKKAKTVTVQASQPAGSKTESLTEEQVNDKAAKLGVVANKEIKKQMKLVPSCKRGSAKRSYTGTVPNETVFMRMFRLSRNSKGKKWRRK